MTRSEEEENKRAAKSLELVRHLLAMESSRVPSNGAGNKSKTDVKRDVGYDDASSQSAVAKSTNDKTIKSSAPVVRRIGPEDGFPFRVQETFPTEAAPERDACRRPATAAVVAPHKRKVSPTPAPKRAAEPVATGRHIAMQASQDAAHAGTEERVHFDEASAAEVRASNRVLYARLAALNVQKRHYDHSEWEYFSSGSDYGSESEPDSIS